MVLRRIARPLLSVAFVGQGVNSLLNPKSAAEAAAPAVDGLRSLPDPVGSSIPSDPETVARITAAVQVGGGLLLATGKLPRVASAALALTVLPANLGTHTFWNEPDPEVKAQKRQQFLTDLSLVGGLMIASADTAGKPSLGWRGRRAAERLSERVSAALPGSERSMLSGTSARRSCTACRPVPNAVASWPAPPPKRRPYAEAALERGRELASTAAERSAPLGQEGAQTRREELARNARERGAGIGRDGSRARQRVRRHRGGARQRMGRGRPRTSRRRDLDSSSQSAAVIRASEIVDDGLNILAGVEVDDDPGSSAPSGSKASNCDCNNAAGMK